METFGVFSTLLAFLIAYTSYKGLRDERFFEDNLFWIGGILHHKQYQRMMSSGFLHANWWHLVFNLVALVSFGESIELLFGYWQFGLLYFLSLLGGNLLALAIHQAHVEYRAVGASGAISGVVLAYIVMDPGGYISFFLLPLEIPAWIFGLAFILISILGIKAQEDNIGHEAHLGGAITGVIVYSLFEPEVAWANWGIVVAILVPTVLFLYWIYRFPEVLLVRSYWGPSLFNRAMEETVEFTPEEELNTLLDKIKAQGIESLSKKERSRLQQLSEKQR